MTHSPSRTKILHGRLLPVLILLLLAGDGDATTEPYVIRNAREPIFVPCALPEPSLESRNAISGDAHIALLIETIKDQARANPHRLIVLDPAQISGESRGNLAELMFEAIRITKQTQPRILLSIRGIPREESRAPDSFGERDRLAVLVNAVDVLFPDKTLILSNQIDELQSLRRSAPKTWAAARGRPILFRTNRAWRIALPRDASSSLATATGFPQDFPSLPEGELLTMSVETNALPAPPDYQATINYAQTDGWGSISPPGLGGGSGSGSGAGTHTPTPSSGDQSEYSPPPQTRFLLSNIPFGENTTDIVNQVNAQFSYIIYQRHIDPDRAGVVNLTLLSDWIKHNIPAEYSGFACLDIEDPYMRHLQLHSSHPDFQKSVNQLTRALKRAKLLRPHAQWTIYSLPILKSQTPTTQELNNAKAPSSLWSELDWFAPSLYDRHPPADGQTFTVMQREFVESITNITREIAGNRLVIPFIWHRYITTGEPNSPPSYERIPEEELRSDQIFRTLAAGADGLFWWNMDAHFLKVIARRDPPFPANHADYDLQRYLIGLFSREIPPGISDDEYLESLYLRYLEFVASSLRTYSE